MRDVVNQSMRSLWQGRLLTAGGTLGLCVLLLGCDRPSAQGEKGVSGSDFPISVATPKLMRPKLVKYTYPKDPAATWTVLASGVRWRDVVVGDGAELTSDSIGYFHIHTFLTDGSFHHSSMNERKPVCAAMGADRLQREFEEALIGMRERGRRIVEFPKGLSYFSQGHLAEGPPLPAGCEPKFDVTLLIVKPQPKLARSLPASETTSSPSRKEVSQSREPVGISAPAGEAR